RHNHQQQRSEQKHSCGRLVVKGPRIERVMQAISSPADLPRPKVRLASLFIEIGEEQEQEQRNNAGDDGNNVRDKDERETVHVALIEREMTKKETPDFVPSMVSHHGGQHNSVKG